MNDVGAAESRLVFSVADVADGSRCSPKTALDPTAAWMGMIDDALP